jgi:SagB-type dehydrogenase family enzyme
LKAGRRRFLRSGVFLSLLAGSAVAGLLGLTTIWPARRGGPRVSTPEGYVKLPPPRFRGEMSVEEAILKRRSRREYLDKPLTLGQLSQLLWAAQGVTEPALWVGLRSAPSAGGLYPLELYAVVRENGVEGLEAGVYHYLPHDHAIRAVVRGDISRELMAACIDQEWVGAAPVNFVFTAVFERTSVKYGERARQYVFQESGHAAQNIYLQATAMGLGGTVIGAFIESMIQELLALPHNEVPIYVMPVGVVS